MTTPEQQHFLAKIASGEITVELDRDTLRDFRDDLRRIVRETEALRDRIQQAAGPVPAPLPAHLLTMLQLGLGYSRHCRDTIHALFRARRALEPITAQSEAAP